MLYTKIIRKDHNFMIEDVSRLHSLFLQSMHTMTCTIFTTENLDMHTALKPPDLQMKILKKP